MRKKEQLELEDKLKESFIKSFHFEYLSNDDKQIFTKIMFYAIINSNENGTVAGGKFTTAYNTAATNIQNFHILKALKENNDKFDTLIELLSKDKV